MTVSRLGGGVQLVCMCGCFGLRNGCSVRCVEFSMFVNSVKYMSATAFIF